MKQAATYCVLLNFLLPSHINLESFFNHPMQELCGGFYIIDKQS